jgi:hypothetical protein
MFSSPKHRKRLTFSRPFLCPYSFQIRTPRYVIPLLSFPLKTLLAIQAQLIIYFF